MKSVYDNINNEIAEILTAIRLITNDKKRVKSLNHEIKILRYLKVNFFEYLRP